MSGFSSKKLDKIKPEKPATGGPSRAWSKEQNAIFKAFENSDANLVIRARAGTGKTTTILEGCNRLHGKTLLCAFNKRIADELKGRAPMNVHVYTLHGLGFRLVKRLKPSVQVDSQKGYTLARRIAPEFSLTRDSLKAAVQLAAISKEVAPFKVDEGSMFEIGTSFGCFDHLYGQAANNATRAAIRLRDLTLTTLDELNTIDFADMLFIPLQKALTRGEYDTVIVDEAQDMNRAQLEIAQRIAGKNGRLIVVGDDRQAIYGFRGADSGSIDRLKKALSAEELPLTTTYRCPQAICAIAQAIVPDIKSEKPGGEILFGTRAWLYDHVQAGDFVLSRTNAPLLRVCMELTARGKKARIEGRDIGQGLIAIIDKLSPKSADDLLTLLQEWWELAMHRAGEDTGRQDTVTDQRYVLEEMAKATTLEAMAGVAYMKRRIEELFTEVVGATDAVICSTVHRVKGLEADRVFVLCDTFKGQWRGGGSEESNLKYVAVTRAKQTLVWVDPPVGSGLAPQKGVSKHVDQE